MISITFDCRGTFLETRKHSSPLLITDTFPVCHAQGTLGMCVTQTEVISDHALNMSIVM